ncbi:MAG: NADH-quinone oxidoreductase subunit C [Methanomassiliicoccaceae archaeon]|nr:NADH-quinone oxidoreductase subunit C [Methanomassiliicoccaceae archaeon]MCL2145812.1 NADH-quinone oxidoreductase subunit C [Methanomassiliicoccaceae archaeon]
MADEVYKAPTVQEISDLLRSEFPGKVEITGTEERRVYAKADRDSIHEICAYIQKNLTFEHVTSIMGNDMVDHMEVIYHLSNYFNGVIIVLTAELPADDLHIRSVAGIWVGGNWHERETYELFGIIFDGHPKLQRLLTPDTYEFYPFRKSYKLRGQE